MKTVKAELTTGYIRPDGQTNTIYIDVVFDENMSFERRHTLFEQAFQTVTRQTLGAPASIDQIEKALKLYWSSFDKR